MSGGAFRSSIRQRSVFLGRVCRDILSLFNRGCSFHDVLFVREFVNTGFTGEPVGVSFFPGERRIADICFRGRVVVAGEPFYPVSFLKLVGTGDNILLVVRLPGRAISRVVGFSGELAGGNFSTIVGFMHSSTCLLQRGIFLSLGIGLLCLAVPCSRRLSRESGRNVFFSIMGCLFLVLTVWAGYIYMDIFRERQVNRESYREIFSRYESIPRTRIVTHDITYMPLENGFSAQSRMTVVNRAREKMKRLILYLNPGLQIHKLAESGQDISFLRDGQAVVVERELNPGDSTVMEMVYGGKIDEDIYRVGVDNEAYFTPERQVDVERYGKRTAFVSRDYTLLIPEILWYPVAIPPTVLETFREVDFTIYVAREKS